MSKYRELFSYQTRGMGWVSVVIDVETGIPYTAGFQLMCMGGACYPEMQTLGAPISYERIYELALRNQENEPTVWFDPEKYKGINASNWKDFI